MAGVDGAAVALAARGRAGAARGGGSMPRLPSRPAACHATRGAGAGKKARCGCAPGAHSPPPLPRAAAAAMSKAAKVFSVGGVGAQPTLDDVARVAGGLAIALDHAGAERIKKESPAPKNFAAEAYQPSPAQQGAALSAEQARAVIIVKLLAIMNGKSGARLQLAEYLAGLLNNGITPALPAAAEDDAVLGALADACQPEGAAAIAAQLEAAGLSAPAVSSAERVVLQSGASASAGVGALAVQAGKTLLSIATAVAALSCEAFGTQVGLLGRSRQRLAARCSAGSRWSPAWRPARALSCSRRRGRPSRDRQCSSSMAPCMAQGSAARCPNPLPSPSPGRSSPSRRTWWRRSPTRPPSQPLTSCAACWRAPSRWRPARAPALRMPRRLRSCQPRWARFRRAWRRRTARCGPRCSRLR